MFIVAVVGSGLEVKARRTYLSLDDGVKSGVAMANAFCNSSSSIKNCRIVCLYWNWNEKEIAKMFMLCACRACLLIENVLSF